MLIVDLYYITSKVFEQNCPSTKSVVVLSDSEFIPEYIATEITLNIFPSDALIAIPFFNPLPFPEIVTDVLSPIRKQSNTSNFISTLLSKI